MLLYIVVRVDGLGNAFTLVVLLLASWCYSEPVVGVSEKLLLSSVEVIVYVVPQADMVCLCWV